MKDSEEYDIYMDLIRKLKKLLNIKAKVMLIVVGGIRIVPKDLEK